MRMLMNRPGGHLPALALAVLMMAGVATAARAAQFTYNANLDGASESPPNASPGTGFVTVVVDDVVRTMHISGACSGLLGTTTAAHIHASTAVAGTGTAGVATTLPSFVGFPLGVTAGAFDFTLDLSQASSYSASFITANGGTVAGAETALLLALANGTAYFNVHTTVFAGGEIRGFPNSNTVSAEQETWGSLKSLYR